MNGKVKVKKSLKSLLHKVKFRQTTATAGRKPYRKQGPRSLHFVQYHFNPNFLTFEY